MNTATNKVIDIACVLLQGYTAVGLSDITHNVNLASTQVKKGYIDTQAAINYIATSIYPTFC